MAKDTGTVRFADGSVTVPAVLRGYMGGLERIERTG